MWDDEIAAAVTPQQRLLAVFDALERFRADQPHDRGCAFLAAAVELPGTAHPALAVVRADTDHLRSRLTTLARDTGVADAQGLAEQVLLAYDGALSAFLRQQVTDPVRLGRDLAGLALAAAHA